jgi:hypothetical protein
MLKIPYFLAFSPRLGYNEDGPRGVQSSGARYLLNISGKMYHLNISGRKKPSFSRHHFGGHEYSVKLGFFPGLLSRYGKILKNSLRLSV